MVRSIDKILRQRAGEIQSQIEELNTELKDIEIALNAISKAHVAPPASIDAHGPPPRINDSIVEAIKNGCGKPTEIKDFLSQHLGVETTKASISTRLSKMKSQGLISNVGNGWVVPSKNRASSDDTDEALKITGEVDASPDVPRKVLGMPMPTPGTSST